MFALIDDHIHFADEEIFVDSLISRKDSYILYLSGLGVGCNLGYCFIFTSDCK